MDDELEKLREENTRLVRLVTDAIKEIEGHALSVHAPVPCDDCRHTLGLYVQRARAALEKGRALR